MLSRDRKQTKTGIVSLFSGKLKCYECERAMTHHKSIRIVKRKKYINNYYRCGSYIVGGKKACSSHMISEKKLEELLLKAIQFEIKKVIEVEKVLNQIKNSGMQIAKEIKYRSIKENNNKVENDIKQLKALKGALYEDFKLNILSETDYREYSIQYDYQIEQLTKRKSYYNAELQKLNTSSDNNTKWIELFTKYKNITEINRAVLDDLVNYIYIVDKNHIVIDFYYADEYETIIEYIENNDNFNKVYAKEIKKFKYEKIA